VSTNLIPDTKGGRAYRRILLVAGVFSVIGIADQLRALFWMALIGPSPGRHGPVQPVILLVGWALICWIAVRAVRTNALPPRWAAFSLPLLLWAYLLWPD
jgi:hypothetical protein